jgi:hypothetical protein
MHPNDPNTAALPHNPPSTGASPPAGGPAAPGAEDAATRPRGRPLNALRHGATSRTLVLLDLGETHAEWTAHRDGIVASLAPVGALEVSLAERVAELVWRQRRVVRAEGALVRRTAEGAEPLVVADALNDLEEVQTIDDLRVLCGVQAKAQGAEPAAMLAAAERRLGHDREAALVPTCARGEALARYEAHLARQIAMTLATLKACRDLRVVSAPPSTGTVG